MLRSAPFFNKKRFLGLLSLPFNNLAHYSQFFFKKQTYLAEPRKLFFLLSYIYSSFLNLECGLFLTCFEETIPRQGFFGGLPFPCMFFLATLKKRGASKKSATEKLGSQGVLHFFFQLMSPLVRVGEPYLTKGIVGFPYYGNTYAASFPLTMVLLRFTFGEVAEPNMRKATMVSETASFFFFQLCLKKKQPW